MKNSRILYIVSLALISLAGCTKTQTYSAGHGSAISLSPVTEVSKTKGVITGTTFPTSRSMVVSADLNADTGGSGNYFSNLTFTYNSTPAAWQPANTYYWPLSGTLEMLAYSAGSASVTPAWTNATQVILTCADCTADDILMGGLTGANPSSKQIVFKHCLAKASFKAKGTVASVIKVKGITLNFKKGASLTVTKSAGNSAVAVSTTPSGAATDNSMFSGNQTLTTTMTDIGNVMLIPEQTPASVTVTYTITNNSVESGTMTVTKALSTAMAAGKHYTYELTFTLTGLNVTATLTDWSSGGTTDVSI